MYGLTGSTADTAMRYARTAVNSGRSLGEERGCVSLSIYATSDFRPGPDI
jgi:hypothetical protein